MNIIDNTMVVYIESYNTNDTIKYATEHIRPRQRNGLLWCEDTKFLWAIIYVPSGTGEEWIKINLPNHKLVK